MLRNGLSLPLGGTNSFRSRSAADFLYNTSKSQLDSHRNLSVKRSTTQAQRKPYQRAPSKAASHHKTPMPQQQLNVRQTPHQRTPSKAASHYKIQGARQPQTSLRHLTGRTAKQRPAVSRSSNEPDDSDSETQQDDFENLLFATHHTTIF